MIVGIGIDLIEISRIKHSIEKHGTRFKNRVFTPAEIQYCDSGGRNIFSHYAARFAAKEAVMKALGLGWQQGSSWREIEVVRTDLGQPQIQLTGSTAKSARKVKAAHIHLSLTHSNTHAAAFVVIEK